jgi:hypothetical protein
LLAVDEHGRIPGVADVFAAGDATTFPLKQGGLAAQQADAAAETIAADPALPPSRRGFGRYCGAPADRRRAAVPARCLKPDWANPRTAARAPHDRERSSQRGAIFRSAGRRRWRARGRQRQLR